MDINPKILEMIKKNNNIKPQPKLLQWGLRVHCFLNM